MPLKGYGVLKSQPISTMVARDSAHLEIHTVDEEKHYRIAVNARSQTVPPELRYIIFDSFKHPITNKLPGLDNGFTLLQNTPQGGGLDYIRGNLFDYHDMKIAHHIAGSDNELLYTIQKYVDNAVGTKDAAIYAFGQSWGPESKRDQYFGFKPGGGIHDIHMNQGNAGRWMNDNGVWQDGGMFIHFPAEDRWVAIFLAFQSQSFHTDDKTGHPIEDVRCPEENTVIIVAALLNPIAGTQSISILNTTPDEIDLSGWALADINKNRLSLSGTIGTGNFMTIPVSNTNFDLPDSGGIISILDSSGIKINGVKYTAAEYSGNGRTFKF
ncbi:DUF2278 family protein [Acetivibrio cellulolyticus]|uniref:DUF2278 family protein n=1 Tax=Acetivibrio cellulolyticus TaxID=35830 RepID=UPI0001E2F0DC|nr:DUF2278 family protein [Acetivibrio cellulolyticus]